jgi:hypothetical protein
MNTRCIVRTLLSAAVLAGIAGQAVAASHDYEVHSSAYTPSPISYQPAYISKNGVALTAPADACGMRFEGDFNLLWEADNGSFDESHGTGGGADVYLPDADCSALTGVTIFGDNDYDWTVPYGFNGTLSAYARGYWIDTDGDKLIYKYQPCSPMPQCILGPQRFVANGWADGLKKPVRELTVAVDRIVGTTATVPLANAEKALALGARTVSERIALRRGVNTGTLELPMRQLEDHAQAAIAGAQRDFATCKAAMGRSDRSSGYRACGEALRKLESARSALDAGDAWID